MNTLNNNQQNSSITSRILDRIATEHITPRRRLVFVLREWGVWILWFLTVLIGALAVAVSLYVAMNAEYAMFEATHANFFTFVIEVLPYVWLGLFAVMSLVAIKQLRHTKHGYRYSTATILGSSLLCSIVGGGVFHYMGFGFALDGLLGKQIGYYMSMEKMDLKMWQKPEAGRLVGVLVPRPETTQSDTPLMFEDIRGVRWEIGDSELTDREMYLLMNVMRVRLLGTSTAPGLFHVCGVFPWMFDRPMARSEMEQERAEFDARMRFHKRMQQSETAVPEQTSDNLPLPAGDRDDVPADQICAHLEMMGRMR